MSKWSSAYRDSRWQKKRLEIMQRDEFACVSCEAKGEGVLLNVHHIYYESGKAPWEYEDRALVTLCDECHTRLHELMKRLWVSVCMGGVPAIPHLCSILGFAESNDPPFSFQLMSTDCDEQAYAGGYIAGEIPIDELSARDRVAIMSRDYVTGGAK